MGKKKKVKKPAAKKAKVKQPKPKAKPKPKPAPKKKPIAVVTVTKYAGLSLDIVPGMLIAIVDGNKTSKPCKGPVKVTVEKC